jgi:hypothetical protein
MNYPLSPYTMDNFKATYSTWQYKHGRFKKHPWLNFTFSVQARVVWGDKVD